MKKRFPKNTNQLSTENSKLVLRVYWILRGLVLVIMLAQILKKNYEHVYICLLTLVLFSVPSFLERRLRVDLPDALEIVILIFIFAAEILGEIQEYYLTFPLWDTVLHTINGFLFAAIGFCLVNLLNENKRVALSLAPFYVAVTAFCFSMTIGVFWEFFEWAMDSWFGLDMQKDTVMNAFHTVNLDPGGRNVVYRVKDVTDTVLVFANGEHKRLGLGGYLDLGLQDTMMDLLVNFFGAAIFSIIGYFYVRSKGKGRIARMFIPKVIGKNEKTT